MVSPTENINNIPDRLKPERKYLGYSLDRHLQMDRSDYILSIEALLLKRDYGIALWQDPWLVFKKNAADVVPRDTIRTKLDALKKHWKA